MKITIICPNPDCNFRPLIQLEAKDRTEKEALRDCPIESVKCEECGSEVYLKESSDE